MLGDWANLDLLWHPGHSRKTASKRQRTRRILDDIAALSLVRSTRTFWRGLAADRHRLSPSAVHSGPKLRSAAAAVAYAIELGARVRQAKRVWRDGVSLRNLTPLEDLAMLQHFGTHTPLLDLTADPLVALYFAVRHHPEADGLVVGWNAIDWPDLTSDDRRYPDILKRLESDREVGWFVPPVITDRVVVQRSRMLVAPVRPQARTGWWTRISDLDLPELPPGWNADQLKALFAATGQGRRAMPPVVAFRVNRGLKGYILQILSESYGIDHKTMFPDPAGYSMEQPQQSAFAIRPPTSQFPSP